MGEVWLFRYYIIGNITIGYVLEEDEDKVANRVCEKHGVKKEQLVISKIMSEEQFEEVSEGFMVETKNYNKEKIKDSI